MQLHHALSALGLVGIAACTPSPRLEAEPFEVAAPAYADQGAFCTDVGEVRGCWEAPDAAASCVECVCLVERPLPAAPAPGGWRCHGQRTDRRCIRRARGVGRFECAADVCVQPYPRAPDDGAWTCVDLDGVVICSGGEPPAGIVAGAGDPAFFCGVRRGRGERLCVDLAPDLPDLGARRWACRFEYTAGEVHRICKRAAAGVVGGACGEAAASCPAATRCVGGRCLPDRAPRPECWLDGDCDVGQACRRGTCVGSSP